MDEKQMTVLESIIKDTATALFQKWINALPEDQRTDENISNLSKNATEATYFVVKVFMDKFNAEAEVLRSQD
jgi:SUMO ligase MMS21 Smc5/6 complex component